MIPLVGYLVFMNSSQRIKTLALWFIQVVNRNTMLVAGLRVVQWVSLIYGLMVLLPQEID